MSNLPIYDAWNADRDRIKQLEQQLFDANALINAQSNEMHRMNTGAAHDKKQIVMLREALKEIVGDYEDRFDMTSPSTNPGIKFVVKQGTEALNATQDLSGLIPCDAEPVGWMRKWASDKEVPAKVKGDNGRWHWPKKFKILPITESKWFDDDIAIYKARKP
jgi:hypothetical protein